MQSENYANIIYDKDDKNYSRLQEAADEFLQEINRLRYENACLREILRRAKIKPEIEPMPDDYKPGEGEFRIELIGGENK